MGKTLGLLIIFVVKGCGLGWPKNCVVSPVMATVMMLMTVAARHGNDDVTMLDLN
jgi:hypothetical protein